MKTLCLTLLLLSVYCCSAALQATAPGRCCFGFQTRSLPLRLVSGVVRTHSACLKPAFISDPGDLHSEEPNVLHSLHCAVADAEGSTLRT
uniref:Chemokine interleukin-8-like domain-containing protein n=1 Tax=Stegastes partitus TaxID=144197 RepID=A0A3B5BBX0_9TELE